jgi:hypothetical protein
MHYKAYILLAHQNPEQLNKLIQLLEDKSTVFFIHLDKKVDITLFNYLEEKDNVFFVQNREVCNWGGFSLVKATYNALEETYHFFEKRSIKSYHCVLLSGQDMPIQTTKSINAFLMTNKDVSFFNYWQLPYKNWWDGGMFRVTNLYLFNVKKHKTINTYINKVINRLGLKKLLPINKLNRLHKEFKLYGSSQWFIINHDALRALIKNKKTYRQLSKALRFSFAPDELFFISFFKYIQLKEALNIENKKTMHVVFEGVNPNPKFLEIKDLQSNFEKHTLFGRKFDNKVNPEAIKVVEKRITH